MTEKTRLSEQLLQLSEQKSLSNDILPSSSSILVNEFEDQQNNVFLTLHFVMTRK